MEAILPSSTHEYVGKTLSEAPSPSALLDLSIIRKNCVRMLEVVDALEFGWRAHIKTHKVIRSLPYRASCSILGHS